MMADTAPAESVLDRTLNVTVWKTMAPREAHGGPTTLRTLAKAIETRHASRKDQLYWLKLATFGNIATAKGYLRNNDNVLKVGGLEADYDGGEFGVDWAVNQALKANIGCIIYTSPSHTIDTPRWRVLAPFSEDLDPDMRRVLMGRLAGAFQGVFAAESWVLSQSYYYGFVDGNSDAHRVELVDGDPIDLLHELDKVWRDKPNTKPRHETDGTEDGPPIDAAELDMDAVLEDIRAGKSYHPAIRSIAAKLIAEGRTRDYTFRAIMEAGAQVFPADRDRRWADRFSPNHVNDILDWVIGQEKKKLFTMFYDGEYVDPPEEKARTEEAEFKERKAEGASGNLFLSAAEFVGRFAPPAYLIDGIIQRGYLYSLTARTGHGKTAVDMHLAQCIARGTPFHNRETRKGTVLFCAGENPDDIRARFLVLAEAANFDIADIDIRFIDGVIDIEKSFPKIVAAAQSAPNLQLIIVDTAAAYFVGTDTNANKEQIDFARVLRRLTIDLPTRPAVIVNCHPVKNAAKDNLLPMGGSGFVNEVDGNLTLWKGTDDTTELHWQGKFRGPEFEPITFRLETVTCDAVKDDRGRLMPSVVAKAIGEAEIAHSEALSETDEDILLAIIANNKPMSLSTLALKAGWTFPNGAPAKSKVQRVIARLLDDKLVTKVRGHKYRATTAGQKEAGLDDE